MDAAASGRALARSRKINRNGMMRNLLPAHRIPHNPKVIFGDSVDAPSFVSLVSFASLVSFRLLPGTQLAARFYFSPCLTLQRVVRLSVSLSLTLCVCAVKSQRTFDVFRPLLSLSLFLSRVCVILYINTHIDMDALQAAGDAFILVIPPAKKREGKHALGGKTTMSARFIGRPLRRSAPGAGHRCGEVASPGADSALPLSLSLAAALLLSLRRKLKCQTSGPRLLLAPAAFTKTLACTMGIPGARGSMN